MCVHLQRSREAYIDYHADSGQGGGKVLGVRRSDVHRNASSVEAAVEGGDQINAWEREGRQRWSKKRCLKNQCTQLENGSRTHWEGKATPRSLQC